MGLCTDKQAELLEKYGYDSNVSFEEAREILDELAANNWKRPGRNSERGSSRGDRGERGGRGDRGGRSERGGRGDDRGGRDSRRGGSRDSGGRNDRGRDRGGYRGDRNDNGGRGANRSQRRGMENPDGPPTEAQAKLLEDYDYNPDKFTKKEASELIDEIKQAGWRRPDDGWSPRDEKGNDDGDDGYDDAPGFGD